MQRVLWLKMYSFVNFVKGRSEYSEQIDNPAIQIYVNGFVPSTQQKDLEGSYYTNHDLFSDLSPRTDADQVRECALFPLPF